MLGFWGGCWAKGSGAGRKDARKLGSAEDAASAGGTKPLTGPMAGAWVLCAWSSAMGASGIVASGNKGNVSGAAFPTSDNVASGEGGIVPAASRGDDMHFATYLGLQAGWGRSFGGQRNFYLGRNAALWRAVPIACSDAASRTRSECAKHESTPYSIADINAW